MKKQTKCHLYTRVSTAMLVDGLTTVETVVLMSQIAE